MKRIARSCSIRAGVLSGCGISRQFVVWSPPAVSLPAVRMSGFLYINQRCTGIQSGEVRWPLNIILDKWHDHCELHHYFSKHPTSGQVSICTRNPTPTHTWANRRISTTTGVGSRRRIVSELRRRTITMGLTLRIVWSGAIKLKIAQSRFV